MPLSGRLIIHGSSNSYLPTLSGSDFAHCSSFTKLPSLPFSPSCGSAVVADGSRSLDGNTPLCTFAIVIFHGRKCLGRFCGWVQQLELIRLPITTVFYHTDVRFRGHWREIYLSHVLAFFKITEEVEFDSCLGGVGWSCTLTFVHKEGSDEFMTAQIHSQMIQTGDDKTTWPHRNWISGKLEEHFILVCQPSTYWHEPNIMEYLEPWITESVQNIGSGGERRHLGRAHRRQDITYECPESLKQQILDVQFTCQSFQTCHFVFALLL